VVKLGNSTAQPTLGGKAYVASPHPVARYKLSGAGDDNGMVALVSGSANAKLIHTCDSTAVDEVYLWAGNYESANAKVVLGIGDKTSEDKTIMVNIASQSGLIQIYPGVPHQNTEIYAWTNTNTSINLVGFVMRHYLLNPNDTSLGYDGTE